MHGRTSSKISLPVAHPPIAAHEGPASVHVDVEIGKTNTEYLTVVVLHCHSPAALRKPAGIRCTGPIVRSHDGPCTDIPDRGEVERQLAWVGAKVRAYNAC